MRALSDEAACAFTHFGPPFFFAPVSGFVDDLNDFIAACRDLACFEVDLVAIDAEGPRACFDVVHGLYMFVAGDLLHIEP